MRLFLQCNQDLPAPGFMSSAPGGLGEHEAGAQCRVFQGGFYQDLHKMLDISSGGEARPTRLMHPCYCPYRLLLRMKQACARSLA